MQNTSRGLFFRCFLWSCLVLGASLLALAEDFEVKKGQAVSLTMKNGYRIEGVVLAVGDALELEIVANSRVTLKWDDIEDVKVLRQGIKRPLNVSPDKKGNVQADVKPKIVVERRVEQPAAFLESLNRLCFHWLLIILAPLIIALK